MNSSMLMPPSNTTRAVMERVPPMGLEDGLQVSKLVRRTTDLLLYPGNLPCKAKCLIVTLQTSSGRTFSHVFKKECLLNYMILRELINKTREVFQVVKCLIAISQI